MYCILYLKMWEKTKLNDKNLEYQWSMCIDVIIEKNLFMNTFIQIYTNILDQIFLLFIYLCHSSCTSIFYVLHSYWKFNKQTIVNQVKIYMLFCFEFTICEDIRYPFPLPVWIKRVIFELNFGKLRKKNFNRTFLMLI